MIQTILFSMIACLLCDTSHTCCLLAQKSKRIGVSATPAVSTQIKKGSPWPGCLASKALFS